MKRRNTFTRVIAVLIIALVGIGVSSASAQGTVRLSFFTKWPEPYRMSYFKEVIKGFEAQHPNIKIDMSAVGDQPYKDKIRVLAASGQLPDIFFSWSGAFAKNFVDSGAAMDLTQAYNSTDLHTNVIPTATKPFTFNGHVYGIPLRLDAKFMVYNKAMFAKLGLSVPTTWDQLLSTCKSLKDAGITPIGFGDQYPWAAIHYLTTLNAKLVPPDVRKADYDLTAPADKLFTDPGYVQALTDLRTLVTDGCFNKGPNGLSHDTARAAFGAGQDGMMYVEIVEFYNLKDTPLGNDGWGFFPFPSFPNGRGDQQLLTGAPDGFMVSSKTKHPQEAIEFLNYLMTPQWGAKYVDEITEPSAVQGAMNQPGVLTQLQQGVQDIGKADGMALWLDTAINIKVVNPYLNGAQAVIAGTETPADLMKKVHDAAVTTQQQVKQ